MPYEILAQQDSNSATKYLLLPVSLLSLSYLVYLISWETRIALYGMLMLTILVGAILPDRYKPSLTVKNALALITVSTLAVLAYSWTVGASWRSVLLYAAIWAVFTVSSGLMARSAYSSYKLDA